MSKSLFISCLFFYSLQSIAQYPGFTELKNPEVFKKQFIESAKTTESIQADFIQEKSLTMLSEKIISNGRFQFRKNDKLRMEYLHPFTYLMILNDGKIYIKDGQKENTISASANPVLKQVNQILIECLSGSMLDNPDFQSHIYENTGSWLIEFKPIAKKLKELYKNINIVLDKKDFTASSIGMYDASGDKTIIRFQNKELNAQISESLFKIP
jgi:outer membrane lipoprotein-sorting protein